jgi:predicted protein tyrosine phosphatase
MLKEAIKGLSILWNRLIGQGAQVTMMWAADHLVRVVTGAPLQPASKITPELHVGGQYRQRGWSRLKRRGITAVVNMRTEFDDQAAGVAPQRYLHLPTADHQPPSLEDLRAGVDFIAEEISNGGAVYIHCGSGVGRAPTMAAAYFVSTSLAPDQAWARIREVRPFITPKPGQVARLEEFAGTLRPRD